MRPVEDVSLALKGTLGSQLVAALGLLLLLHVSHKGGVQGKERDCYEALCSDETRCWGYFQVVDNTGGPESHGRLSYYCPQKQSEAQHRCDLPQ